MGEFNLGESEHDFRVPYGGLHRPGASGVWHPTAALVIETVSPADERSVHWLGRSGGEYREVERSGLIELGRDELAEQSEWP
jgi:hypothetical protein